MLDWTERTSFNRQLLISAALHFGILFALTVKTYLFPTEPTLIQQSIRVDTVALPDKLKSRSNQSAPLEKPAKPAPTPIAEPISNQKPAPMNAIPIGKSAKQIRQEALARFAAIEKLKKIEHEDTRKTMDEVQKRLDKEQVQSYKGNEISKGSAPTGTAKLQHESYAAQVGSFIKRQWGLPEWLRNARLSAEVAIKIDSRGYIIHKGFVRSSGNQTFDGLVTATIDKSSPLPPPPANLVNFYEHQGITLLFP
jgi:outer membrane biosynthesis protein TonB